MSISVGVLDRWSSILCPVGFVPELSSAVQSTVPKNVEVRAHLTVWGTALDTVWDNAQSRYWTWDSQPYIGLSGVQYRTQLREKNMDINWDELMRRSDPQWCICVRERWKTGQVPVPYEGSTEIGHRPDCPCFEETYRLN